MAQVRQVGALVTAVGGPFLVAIAGFYRDAAGTVTGPVRLEDDE